MDPRDYLASSHQRDYSSISLNIIKYTLLTILLVSSLYLLTVICVFLFNQDSWIESTTATILSYSPSSLSPSSSLVEDYFNGQGIRFTFGQNEGPNANLIASTLNQINIEIELFQIKSALILVYLAIGFISLLSEDYYISLFFAFTSFIGLLFSLVKRSTQLQFDLIIYSTILSLLSFIYCLLLKLNKPKSTYYYGYLQP